MGSCGSGTFSVSVKQRDIVAAAFPVPYHWLPMSNLDLLLPPLHVGVFFCYNKFLPRDDSVKLIKKSLSHALIPFYAFAGEVVQNSQGEPELLCNNRGVDFIHAYADVDLKDIDLYHPDDSIERKLVPVMKGGVFSVQVTELNCGGLVVGCTFDHRVVDAYSINMFLVAWAEIARSKPISFVPNFRRSMLNPRHPPLINNFYDTLFVPLSSLDPPKPCFPNNNLALTSRIYYIKAKDIDHLQYISSLNGNPKRSKLVSFIAFLWKLIAEGEDDGLKTCRMGVVVDGRERLADGFKSSSSMQTYIGNVLSIPYGEPRCEKLKEMPLSQAANMVHDFVSAARTEDHFKGLVDWVELNRPEPAVAKVYTKIKENDGDAVVVSSGLRFPEGSVDFGWGKPQFGSYHFPWGGQTGYVMPMPSGRMNGDWVVYMHMLQKHLDLVETKGGSIFKPLTPTYLWTSN